MGDSSPLRYALPLDEEFEIHDDASSVPKCSSDRVSQGLILKSNTSRAQEPSLDDQARTAALRMELQSLRRINTVVEGVLNSLQQAKMNLNVSFPSFLNGFIANYRKTTSTTINSATSLLSTWTAILSRTEHNQRLLLNSAWQGVTADIQDAENDVLTRRREREKRTAEEQARRDEEVRQRAARDEEDQRRRDVASATPGKRRGGGRKVHAGAAATPRTTSGLSAQSTAAFPKPTPGRAANMQYGRVRGRASGARERGRGI